MEFVWWHSISHIFVLSMCVLMWKDALNDHTVSILLTPLYFIHSVWLLRICYFSYFGVSSVFPSFLHLACECEWICMNLHNNTQSPKWDDMVYTYLVQCLSYSHSKTHNNIWSGLQVTNIYRVSIYQMILVHIIQVEIPIWYIIATCHHSAISWLENVDPR